MNDDFISQLQIGSIFPDIVIPSLCFVKNERITNLEISQIKIKIKGYLKIHKKAYVSDMAIALNEEPRNIVQATKELREECFLS